MRAKKFFAVSAALLLLAVGPIRADQAVIVADSMRYEPAASMIIASGNVHATHPDGEMFGDKASGSVDGMDFEIHGKVRGHFRDKDGSVVNFSCADAFLNTVNGGSRIITGKGGVKLDKRADKLSADKVTWNSSGVNYTAEGNVLGDFEAYTVDADVISRDTDIFVIRTVRSFYEKNRKITVTADTANGIIVNDEVSEMTARGNVVITAPDKEGKVTKATGNMSVYSAKQGTIVLTGKSMVTQTGRNLRSEKITYYIETGHIDATGKPALTFETEGRK